MSEDVIKKYEPLWGEWKIDKLIGEGSFGKVYKVKRTEFGEDYFAAVKIISIPQSETEIKHAFSEGMDEQSVKIYFKNFVSSLLKEIRLMSSLKGNSNIVSLEDYKIIEKTDSIGWDILIRMELLKSFMEYLSEKTLSKRDVIKLGIDMCKALELCQKANIIHRDIKLDNIFVSSHGDFKLGDFGIARQIEKTTSGLSKKGTYTYMAPEVYKGEAYNSTVDIYSLGLVLYRLLNNNRTPFLPDYPAQITHTSREDALVRRISGEAFPLPVNADGRLAEIVLKACSFKPADRYENPLLMKEALESIQYTVDEAPLIYPLGDKVENKSVDYISSNVVTKVDVDATESILGQPIFEKAADRTESIFSSMENQNAHAISGDITESVFQSKPEQRTDNSRLEGSVRQQNNQPQRPFNNLSERNGYTEQRGQQQTRSSNSRRNRKMMVISIAGLLLVLIILTGVSSLRDKWTNDLISDYTTTSIATSTSDLTPTSATTTIPINDLAQDKKVGICTNSGEIAEFLGTIQALGYGLNWEYVIVNINDAGGVVAAVQGCLNLGIDALIVDTYNYEFINGADTGNDIVNFAKIAGVPIFICEYSRANEFSHVFDDSGTDGYISTYRYDTGYQCGEYIANRYQGMKVIYVESLAWSQVDFELSQGFINALKLANMQPISIGDGGNSISETQMIVEGYLDSGDNFDVIFVNDYSTIDGVINAFSKKNIVGKKIITCVPYYLESTAKQQLSDGIIHAYVPFNTPNIMADLCYQQLCSYFRGISYHETITVDMPIIDASSITSAVPSTIEEYLLKKASGEIDLDLLVKYK